MKIVSINFFADKRALFFDNSLTIYRQQIFHFLSTTYLFLFTILGKIYYNRSTSELDNLYHLYTRGGEKRICNKEDRM